MILESGRHSHEKEPLKAKKLENSYKFKERVLETFESPIDIVSREIINVPENMSANMPQLSSMHRTIKRVRRETIKIKDYSISDIPDTLKHDDQENYF